MGLSLLKERGRALARAPVSVLLQGVRGFPRWRLGRLSATLRACRCRRGRHSPQGARSGRIAASVTRSRGSGFSPLSLRLRRRLRPPVRSQGCFLGALAPSSEVVDTSAVAVILLVHHCYRWQAHLGTAFSKGPGYVEARSSVRFLRRPVSGGERQGASIREGRHRQGRGVQSAPWRGPRLMPFLVRWPAITQSRRGARGV